MNRHAHEVARAPRRLESLSLMRTVSAQEEIMRYAAIAMVLAILLSGSSDAASAQVVESSVLERNCDAGDQDYNREGDRGRFRRTGAPPSARR